MKIELDESRPESFREDWPGQYGIFSYLEYAAGVPSALFVITTLKENGKPNACLHAWSSFTGDCGGFFAVMPGLLQNTHTYRNILREKEFCVNFISADYYDNCVKTIERNTLEDDELLVGGFTPEPALTVKPPRIQEAFLSYECTLESCSDLSGKGTSALIIGRVRHAAVEESHGTVDSICGENGFMYNIHTPKNALTGEGTLSAVSKLTPLRILE